MNRDTRVCAVALSGGVDSSYAAFLLRERFDVVVGVSHFIWKDSRCCNVRAISKARALCRRLDIPYHLIDMEEPFRRLVVDDFIATYKRGMTPNPCVRCNERMRFTLFFDAVGDLLRSEGILGEGEDFTFSTGHYARVERRDGRVTLRKGIDPEKDQSYMLYRVPLRVLARCEFPLGGLRKADVVRDAAARGLIDPETTDSGVAGPDPAGAVEESQEACFVDTTYTDFLSRYLPPERGFRQGEIVDTAGAIIGRHRGFINYTIGQRKGLGLGSGPWYVVRIDPDRNRVVVGRREELGRTDFFGVEPVWFIEPGTGVSCSVQVRYRSRETGGVVTPLKDGRVSVNLGAPVTVSPGQSAVFYQGDEVIGGAVIE